MADPISLAVGKIPSGLYVLTVTSAEQSTGMLCSWVQQVSFEPLLISLSMRPDRYACELVRQSKRFTLNILAQTDRELLTHFSKGFGPGEEAFDGVDIEKGASGIPRLKSCLGYIECELESESQPGDHLLLVARVGGGGLRSSDDPYVHVRNSADHY